MALTDKLTNIANAIREKGGTTDKLTLAQMPDAIAALSTGGGSGDDSDVRLAWNGDLTSWNEGGKWDWFFTKYGDKITTSNITGFADAFYNSKIKEIPFDLNFTPTAGTYYSCASMFSGMSNVEKIGKIVNITPTYFNNLFSGCSMLKEVPTFENLRLDSFRNSSMYKASQWFYMCYSIREVPESLLKQLYNPKATSGNFSSMFNYAVALDEIRGINPQTGTLTSNNFSYTFDHAYRVKDIIFATQSDGTPYTVSWKNQTIDLSQYTGWAGYSSAANYLTGYNSGITTDTLVADAPTYAALKDNPDWWSTQFIYSRFNHDSAVNLINSLPDASAYLATQSGATNTVKFKTGAGTNTDGGSVSDLTEEEIAVAAAKGWTISYAA